MALSLFLIVGITIYLARNLYRKLRFRLPPGPSPWPIFGNLYSLKPVTFRCYAEWSEAYGPIMSVWFGSSLHVIVSNSDLAKQVLIDQDQQLADRPRMSSTTNITKGGQDLIWADYGLHYVKVRKICTLELFSPNSLGQSRPIREEEVKFMVRSILEACVNQDSCSKGLQLRKYLGVVALNNISRLVFGKRFVTKEDTIDKQGLEVKAILANEIKIATSLGRTPFIWWLKWISFIKSNVYTKHAARREHLTRKIMEENLLSKKRDTCAMKNCLLTALFSLKEKHDLSDNTIVGVVWDMIIAGMDTIAITSEWAMAEMIKNPRVQQKVQVELDNIIGKNHVMDESNLKNLPYLKCIVKESLRLHPPAPLLLPHKAKANVKINGYDILKGTTVIVNVWAIGRDPLVWTDPLEFKPERFMQDNNIDMKIQEDASLLPFGAGRRMCPAVQLGMNLVMLVLGNLLHNFNWSLVEGMQPEKLDMSERPGLVSYMHTPLQAVPRMRLPGDLYERIYS